MTKPVESIRIIDPHTLGIVERWKERNGVPQLPATKAASKMIERLDALESKANDGRGTEAGMDTEKDSDASGPGHSN